MTDPTRQTADRGTHRRWIDRRRELGYAWHGLTLGAQLAPCTRTFTFRAISLLALAVLVCSGAGPVASCELDPTYGVGGKQTTDFELRSDEARDAVLQPDGKLVVTGGAVVVSRGFVVTAFALTRYLRDGSLDQGFGASGKVITTDFAVDVFGSHSVVANAIALQPDGKLVVVGEDLSVGGVVMARYNADGTLDPTFGTGGKKAFNGVQGIGLHVQVNSAVDVALQPDGKLVVAVGSVVDLLTPRQINFAVLRTNPDGGFDPTFSGGLAALQVGNWSSVDAIALQSDGKIVAAGTANFMQGPGSFFSSDFGVVRLNPDGTLDTAFANGGSVTTDFGGTFEDHARAVTLQPDGKIVAAGVASFDSLFASFGRPGDTCDFALVRYNPDGSFDASFGTGGKVTTDFAGNCDKIFDVALLAGGSLLTVGSVRLGDGTFDFALARYNRDGSLDPACGNSGKVTTDLAGGVDSAKAVVLEPDGKVVVAGQATVGGTLDFGVARYQGRIQALEGCACSGPLFVADAARDRIVRMCRTREGSYAEEVVATGINAGPLTFGPDGNLYVLTGGDSNEFNTVMRYNPGTGASLGTFVPPGSGGLLSRPGYSIQFGPDGDLYVGTDGGLKRYRGDTGAFLGNFADSVYAKWGGDGFLYAISPEGGLRRIDPNQGVPVPCSLPDAPFGGLDVLALEPLGTSSVLFASDYRAIVHFVLQVDDPAVCPILDADNGTIDAFQTCGGRVCKGPPGFQTCSNFMGPLDMVWARNHPGIDPNQFLYAINRQAEDCDLDRLFDGVTVVKVATRTGQGITPAGNSYTGIALQPPPNCNDGNDCTVDSCDNALGCQHTPLSGTACSDNDECTTNDRCQNGTCVGGAPPDCNAGLPQCEFSPGCHPVGGCIIKAVPVPAPCDDGNACTTDDRCEVTPQGPSGLCVGAPRNCDDQNVCTADSCAPASGCVNREKSCLDANACTADRCDPVNDCQHTTAAMSCQPQQSAEAFIDGPNGVCAGGTLDPGGTTCTLSTPTVDLRIPVNALATPTHINILATPADASAGACDFALRHSTGKVATCLQLEPSGQTFATPVTAAFKWANVTPSRNCTATGDTCCVSATDTGGATALEEGALQLFTRGECRPGTPSGRCEVTNAVCITDADCSIALTPECGTSQTATPLCPACPGTGCSGPTLDYVCNPPCPTCDSPCVSPAKCDPAGNAWTVQLSHFSEYALGAVPVTPDHFQCYRPALGNTVHFSTPLTLGDAFANFTTSSLKPVALCTPTSANGENAEAPSHAGRLESYRLEPERSGGLRAQLPLRSQAVVDEFGTHTLDVMWPDRLLVPTATSTLAQPAPLDAPLLNYLTCYRVKPSKGSTPFLRMTVSVVDQLAPAPQELTVWKPTRLCVPVNLAGAQPGAEADPWRLMCYRAVRPLAGRVGPLFTNNEFGPGSMTPRLREELCVPALQG